MHGDLLQFFFAKSGNPTASHALTYLFYIVASYIPSILLTVLFQSSKHEEFPKANFAYNQQDAIEFEKILVILRDLEKRQSTQSDNDELVQIIEKQSVSP